jgi:predicted nucleotidyltransferase
MEDLDAIGAVLGDYDLYEYVVYRCIVGSHAYGLANEASDIDRRGIYLPPAELHWSLFGVPEQLENRETDEVYWELRKFVTLALKANPNILECLYTPIVERTTPVADELLAMRHRFLSKLVYQTYNGYVLSQFKRLEQDLRTAGTIKWKHAMHLIRLLIAGVTVLREGHVPVHVGEHRERLLSVKRGELEWAEVNEWRLALHKEFDRTLEQTSLPERPDYETANAYLVWARRRMVNDRNDAETERQR